MPDGQHDLYSQDLHDILPEQVENKTLERLIMTRLPNLRTLFIGKEQQPAAGQVKWTHKSLLTMKQLKADLREQRANLAFVTGLQ